MRFVCTARRPGSAEATNLCLDMSDQPNCLPGLYPHWLFPYLGERSPGLDKCKTDAFLYLWQASVYGWTAHYEPHVEPVQKEG